MHEWPVPSRTLLSTSYDGVIHHTPPPTQRKMTAAAQNDQARRHRDKVREHLVFAQINRISWRNWE